MTNKFKKLQLEALDKKIKKIRFQNKPKNGWARTIRNSLMISLPVIAKKFQVSPQAIYQMEQGEIDETISLKTLRRLAESLDCELYYALIPRQKSLRKTIQKQALFKAKQIVMDVDKTMTLENQKVKNSKKSVNILAKELSEDLNAKLWN